LEEGLAHKIGKNRYLGFGSLALKLSSDSFLIDWPTRYAGKSDQSIRGALDESTRGALDENWRRPITADQWIDPKVIHHYSELRKALYAQEL
jgi:hypothetical protein